MKQTRRRCDQLHTDPAEHDILLAYLLVYPRRNFERGRAKCQGLRRISQLLIRGLRLKLMTSFCTLPQGCDKLPFHGCPMLQPPQRRQDFEVKVIFDVKLILPGASHPRKSIESLLDRIYKREVQRTASNASLLQYTKCVASCHVERPYSTKASGSQLPLQSSPATNEGIVRV
jgi:hypothetical protein